MCEATSRRPCVLDEAKPAVLVPCARKGQRWEESENVIGCDQAMKLNWGPQKEPSVELESEGER